MYTSVLLQADTCPLLSLELLDLGGPVVYPELEPTMYTDTHQLSLDQLDLKTRYRYKLGMCWIWFYFLKTCVIFGI